MNNSRKEHWEDVYARRSPREVSWYQAEPSLSLQLIEATCEPLDAPVIDVGGGASTLVDHLLMRGHRALAVLDISRRALAVAERRLGARGAAVEWYDQDITRFRAPHPFRVWHDRAVFHFLTDPVDRLRYVQTLHQALPKGGHAIMAAFAIGGPTQCSGLDIVQYDAAGMQRELGPAFQLLEARAEVHVTPAAREQKFGFFRFLRVD